MTITVLGGGLAGSASAISALRAGAGQVVVFEKSAFPRHKVCGEFLSPGVLPILESLGVQREFLAASPYPIHRFALHFPRSSKQGRLASPGFGLSRFTLDRLLLDHAMTLGATVHREPAPLVTAPPVIVATGRHGAAPRGGRLFGFKAHFAGPVNDAVELFFFEGCYVGVSAVEGGATNICGIGPEEALARHGFQPDGLLASFPPLRERAAPLARSMEWLLTGPVQFGGRLESPTSGDGRYFAGDQLNFVDPFTGTGMLVALASGHAAGIAAATGVPPERYQRDIAARLRPAVRASSFFRWALQSGWAERAIPLLPAQWLVSLTRPRV